MILDLKKQEGRDKFKEYANHLVKESKASLSDRFRIEISKKREIRSYKQNNYQHVLFSYFALEYGETKEYIKQEIYKKVVNPEVFLTEYVNKKTGEVREAWRSTADLNTKETTDCVQRFRNWSMQTAMIYLPAPNEVSKLDEMNNLIEQNYQYL